MRALCLKIVKEAASWSGRVDTPDEARATFDRARCDLQEPIAYFGEAECYALFVEAVEKEINDACRFILTDPYLNGYNARIEC